MKSDMINTDEKGQKETLDRMFAAGAHFAYSKSRRHSSAKKFIFGVKNSVEIFDLEKTASCLADAEAFVATLGKRKNTILFVGTKNEARRIVVSAATALDMPYVANRWVGGTLTNFLEIKKRIEYFADLSAKKERGELVKYTKKEQLNLTREIEKFNKLFSGLVSMKELPAAMFVIDPKSEHIAVAEAHNHGIPVVSISGSDCNMGWSNYPIPANDAAITSIAFFTDRIVAAYRAGTVKE